VFERYGKTLRQLEFLLKLQAEGKGNKNVMFVYPDAPSHIEKDTKVIIIDEISAMYYGTKPQTILQTIDKKVYDYPVLTVNEAIENFKNHKNFWGK